MKKEIKISIRDYKEVLSKIETILDGKAHLGDLVERKADAFKILIATILSARTRDTTTDKVVEKLFKKYNTPKALTEIDIEELKILIRQSGYYKQKAKRIKEVSKIIYEDYNSEVPKDFDELVSLPGVGPKTANCVLVFAFNIPALTVDTHMHRIPNRLRWVKTKKPEETEKELKKILPKDLWIRASRTIVRFGQQHCNPLHSKCNTCPIEIMCPKDFTMEEEAKRKRKEAAKRKAEREKAAKALKFVP